MATIYQPQSLNRCCAVLMQSVSQMPDMAKLNYKRMGDAWTPLHFYFYDHQNENKPEPDIAVIVPGIGVRKELVPLLFPEPLPNVELLPIVVSGQEWVLLNCLKSTPGLDTAKSVFCRAPSGTIFLFNEVVVDDPDLRGESMFTIDGSNRAVIFVLEPFMKRVRELGLLGLNFRPIGELVQPVDSLNLH